MKKTKSKFNAHEMMQAGNYKSWNHAGTIRFAVILLIVHIGIALFARKNDDVTIQIKKCQIAPIIDGKLDDRCWREIKPINKFYDYYNKGKVSNDAKMKMTFDNSWLFLGMENIHPDPGKLKEKVKNHDGSLHTDESVELFFDPGTGGKCYFHFVLNSANVKGEKRILRKERDASWSIPWKSATRKTSSGWNVEIAIPLFALCSYGDLENVRINVVRNMFVMEAAGDEKKRLSSLSPVHKSFHETDCFARLDGIKDIRIKIPFLPTVKSVDVTGYQKIDGKYAYGIDLVLKNQSITPGSVNVEVFENDGTSLTKTTKLKKLENKNVKFLVFVKKLRQRDIALKIRDKATGDTFHETIISKSDSLNLINVYLGRNYYTKEKFAIAVCSLSFKDSDLHGSKIICLNAKGKKIGKLTAVKPECLVEIDLELLPIGVSTVNIRLLDNNNQIVCSRDVKLIKRLQKTSGPEYKTDRLNRRILKDGVPFFPFGFLLIGAADPGKDFKKMAEAGYNSAVLWGGYRNMEQVCNFFRQATVYGIGVNYRLETLIYGAKLKGLEKICSPAAAQEIVKITRRESPTRFKVKLITNPKLSHLSAKKKEKIFTAYYENVKDKICKYVERVKSFKNLIAYNSFDEPADFEYEAGLDLYKKVNKLDGYNPTFLLFSSYIHDNPMAVNWCDVAGIDAYWVPAGEKSVKGSINQVAKVAFNANKMCGKIHKPFWIVLQGQYYSGCFKRPIDNRELFCQTYLSLIHGAVSVFYFSYPVRNSILWKAFHELGNQLKKLAPCIVSKPIKQEIKYSPIPLNVEKRLFPECQVALKRYPERGFILLAANSRNYPLKVDYSIPVLKSINKGEVMFRKKSFSINNGSFRDKLPPFAVRAYFFENSNLELPETVKIKVDSTTSGSNPGKEFAFTRAGRTGKKNILPNPSFERSSVGAWPDYSLPMLAYDLQRPYDIAKAMDPKEVYHGKYSLKLSKGEGDSCPGFLFFISPQNISPKAYVYSVYMKGSRNGIKVRIGGGGFKNKVFELTAQWKRYILHGTIPARAGKYNSLVVLVLDKGTVWIDAAQMEAGYEPTGFQQ